MRGKVIQIVENLHRGAVENWLLRMLRHARKRGVDVEWTFYCVLEEPGGKDDEARALGASVVHSPVPLRREIEFMRAMRVELRRNSYDVLHSQHDIMSAVYLMSAVGTGIRKRIVHVHNADESIPTRNPLKRALYREPMRTTALLMADQIVGISNHTLDKFLAGHERRPGRDSVHYYGVDSTPFFGVSADRVKFRRNWGLSENAPILLFAGRLVPEKNPIFAVDVLAQLRCMTPDAIGMFAGAGSLEGDVLRRARELGIEHSVRLLGWRNDLPEIMCCSDWFILPHPEHPVEGFGLAVVEAQLAGLRMLLSRGILDDPLLTTACFRRLSLADGPQVWARAATELLHGPAPSQNAAIAALKESPMDMDRALEGLLQLYA